MRHFILSILVFSLLLPSSIKAEGFYASWKPPFIPVTITVDEDGINISAGIEIITQWGTFGTGYDYNLKKFNKKSLILIIRNKKSWGDKVYEIKNGNELSVFINGSTLVETDNGKVIIDVTNSKNMKIQFAKDKSLDNNKVIPMELNIFRRQQSGDRFKVLTNNCLVSPSSKLKLIFKTNKKSYIYIFHIKESGLVFRLFPMQKLGNVTLNNKNPIYGGHKVYLPSNSFSFQLESEVSNDAIYFIALAKKDSVLESSKYKDSYNNKDLMKYISSHYGNNFNKIYFKVGK